MVSDCGKVKRRLKVDIEVLNDKELFCTERVLVSYAKYYNRDYQVIYAGMLGFHFDYEASKKDDYRIGCHISSGYYEETTIEIARKVLGIEIEYLYDTGDEFISKAKSIIDNGQPVIIKKINYELCDWKRFQGEESYLFLIDYEEESFLCKDIHSGIDKNNIYRISFDNIKANKCDRPNNVYTLHLLEEQDNSWNRIRNDLLESAYIQNNVYEEMKQLSKSIAEYMDFSKESENLQNPYYMPVLFNLMHIERGRVLIAKMFDYFYEKTNEKMFYYLSDLCIQTGKQWSRIRNALMKGFLLYPKIDNLEKRKNLINNIVVPVSTHILKTTELEKKIKQIIIEGESACENIQYGEVEDKTKRNIVEGESTCKNIRYGEVERNDEIFNQISHIEFIDLSSYYNSKAFWKTEFGENTVDITGYSEYFICAEQFEIKKDKIHHVRTLDPVQNDNISCNGQLIKIDKDANYVILVGCCLWNSDESVVEFQLKNEILQCPLELCDWYELEEHSNQVIGTWNARIYVMYHVKDHIDTLQLPINKNYHIFEIGILN